MQPPSIEARKPLARGVTTSPRNAASKQQERRANEDSRHRRIAGDWGARRARGARQGAPGDGVREEPAEARARPPGAPEGERRFPSGRLDGGGRARTRRGDRDRVGDEPRFLQGEPALFLAGDRVHDRRDEEGWGKAPRRPERARYGGEPSASQSDRAMAHGRLHSQGRVRGPRAARGTSADKRPRVGRGSSRKANERSRAAPVREKDRDRVGSFVDLARRRRGLSARRMRSADVGRARGADRRLRRRRQTKPPDERSRKPQGQAPDGPASAANLATSAARAGELTASSSPHAVTTSGPT